MEKLFVYTDGGARGNPGPAAVGVVVKDEKGRTLTQFAKRVGQVTNNVAEYLAVVEALSWLKENRHLIWPSPSLPVSFFLDSRLIVNQLNGLFKVKDAHLRELVFKIRQLEEETSGKVFYQLVPREKNLLADSLVKKTLGL